MQGGDPIRAEILRVRLEEPEAPGELARARVRPGRWLQAPLVIVAADHPARGIVAAGDDAWAMADRADFLRRIAEVLAQPAVDGVLVTPDLFEELLMVNRWAVGLGAPDVLAGKVIVGSVNRGGMAGSVFELDDFASAYTPAAMGRMAIDAAKMLLRIDPESRDSAETLRGAVRLLDRLARRRLPVFLEPVSVPLETEALVRLVGVVSGLGSTTYGRWLKLPMVEGFSRVARASTLPIVLLGGSRPGAPDALRRAVERAMDAAPNVRGIMMGRGVLYPPAGLTPAEAALTIAGAVKPGEEMEVVTWLSR